MALTPSDIEKKTFSTALRGYDLDEVDDFLDEMVVALRELQDELAQARARVAELERDPNAAPPAAPAPIAAPVADESAVGRALVAAQQAADRLLEEARTESDRLLSESRGEADRVLEEARSEADNFARDREQRKAEVEREMAEMNNLVAGVRTQLAVLATTVADKLDEMDAVVAGSKAVEDGGSLTGDEDEGEEAEAIEIGMGDSTEAALDAAVDVEIEPVVIEQLSYDSEDEDTVDTEDGAGSSEIEGGDDLLEEAAEDDETGAGEDGADDEEEPGTGET